MLRASLALALPLLVIAVAQAGGCGGSGSSGGDTAACDDYFDGFTRCVALPAQAGDVAHYRSRFDQLCERLITLPGSSFTADEASTCGKALKDLNCGEALYGSTCKFKVGDLADGAACASAAQCKSAICEITISPPVDGGASSPGLCGVCTPAIAAGQPCDLSAGMNACAQGTVCDGTGGMLTCTPITFGAAGASCGSSSKPCNGGLFCDPSTKTCAAQKAAGAACASTLECTSGLLCDKTSMTCVKATIAPAGQPCGGAVTCVNGLCPSAGTCPTLIADGQPCDSMDLSKTCDLFASCVQGICQAFASDVCK